MKDVVDLGLLVVAIIGIILTFLQVRQTAHTSRASFLADIHNRIIGDEKVTEIFSKVDWWQFEYDQITFPNSEEEKSLDRLLLTLDLMCKFYYQKKLEKDDVMVFEYFFHRLNSNDETASYFSTLSDHVKRFELKQHPFANFLRFSRELFGDSALPG